MHPDPDYALAPAGTTPASEWVGEVFYLSPEAPPIVFAPQTDPQTGEITHLFVAADPIPCALVRQFRTRLASGAAVTNDGRDYLQGLKADDTAPARVRSEVRRIFAPFVRRGDVKLEEPIDVQVSGNRVTFTAIFVDYRGSLPTDRQKLTMGATL